MIISELKHTLTSLDRNFKAVDEELLKYKDMAYILLETESVGKIARYGKDSYRNNYLKNPLGNCSDFMNSFLYLKNTEHQLETIKSDIIFRKNIIKESIKKSNGRLRHK